MQQTQLPNWLSGMPERATRITQGMAGRLQGLSADHHNSSTMPGKEEIQTGAHVPARSTAAVALAVPNSLQATWHFPCFTGHR